MFDLYDIYDSSEISILVLIIIIIILMMVVFVLFMYSQSNNIKNIIPTIIPGTDYEKKYNEMMEKKGEVDVNQVNQVKYSPSEFSTLLKYNPILPYSAFTWDIINNSYLDFNEQSNMDDRYFSLNNYDNIYESYNSNNNSNNNNSNSDKLKRLRGKVNKFKEGKNNGNDDNNMLDESYKENNDY